MKRFLCFWLTIVVLGSSAEAQNSTGRYDAVYMLLSNVAIRGAVTFGGETRTNWPAGGGGGGLSGNGYTNELGTVSGFYIAVTNGLVEAVAYSPVLYSGGNTGLVSDANWVGVGTNFTGSGTWIYDPPSRSWQFTANFPPSGGSTQAVSIVVVRPTDWVWGRGGSTISNAIAPVWFHQRTAARSVSGLSWVSAVTNAPHGRYMSAEPQFLELAHDWGTNWAFRIWLSASTTSPHTNRFDVRVTAPNGEQWSTNNYTVAQANTILPLDVPTNAFSAYMVGSGATNRWVIEMEVWSRAGTSSTVHNVESVLKVIR